MSQKHATEKHASPPDQTTSIWRSRISRCSIPHAPFNQSLTSRYLRARSHPLTSHTGFSTDGNLVSEGGAASCGSTDTGTENMSFIRPSESSRAAGFISPGSGLVVDIHRYMVGMSSTGSNTSPSGASEPSRADCTIAGVADIGVRSSAVDSTLRLFFDLLCFLSKRLMVSACPQQRAHERPCVALGGYAPFRPRASFPSGSYACARFLRAAARSQIR